MIFLASGVMALLAAPLALVMFGSTVAVPFAVVVSVAAVYSGYRMWKAAHPAASVWREASRRTVAVITFGVTVVAIVLAREFPQILLVIIGVWLVVAVVGLMLVARAERSGR